MATFHSPNGVKDHLPAVHPGEMGFQGICACGWRSSLIRKRQSTAWRDAQGHASIHHPQRVQ